MYCTVNGTYPAAEVLKDVAALSVEDAHTLSQVVSLKQHRRVSCTSES